MSAGTKAKSKVLFAMPGIDVPYTREDWLMAAAGECRDQLFGPRAAIDVPNFRMSVGWPAGKRGSRKKDVSNVIGECWNAKAVEDGVAAIFVSPVLSDPVKVLAVLVHEMVHAARPAAGHGSGFRDVAVAVGLEGPMRATEPGGVLQDTLGEIASKLGPYPHAAIDPHDRKIRATRSVKMQCIECKYSFRTSKLWAAAARPLCTNKAEHTGRKNRSFEPVATKSEKLPIDKGG